ncbi:hypothetical protein G3T14_15245 [Methylobacterium sp. BTF04]|uniref:glycoside hydrolase family 9 protein n=1 Tax=Methylobacterium sp. BTF04 TaxID=2708300 RepID=UPI0013D6C97F|nr:glycoside hydrolase family 9 protein [Methylobacterium sp. BTF04]NEU13477.1 hypothetical protein [Methylobacterium sp. BTF04]
MGHGVRPRARRPFLRVLALACLIVRATAASAEAVIVQEVTVAAPDIVAVELRDPPFVPGRILTLDAPRTEPQGSWIWHEGQWAEVIGPLRDHVRVSDRPPASHLDRTAIDAAAGYGRIGDRRVVAVYRKSTPYDSGIYRDDDGRTLTGASFRHQIYLKLDGPVPRGASTIVWPGGLLALTPFTYDDRVTRAIALRATQLGHAPGDIAKVAYLALWLPGGPAAGAVDFRPYGLKRFAVVDETGEAVFTADIRLRKAPDDPEPGNSLPKPLPDTVDAASPRRHVTAYGARDRRVSARGHGFRDGDRVALAQMTGIQDTQPIFATVSNATPNSFVVTGADRPLPESDCSGGTVAPAHLANRAGTFVFALDYSDWRPRKAGTYRLHVPGLGMSDPFTVDTDVWLTAARTAIGGLYNHRSGIALDGRFGFRRPAAFRPTPEAPVRMSRLPLAWSIEGLEGFVPFTAGAEPQWLSGRDAPSSFWGGYMDAGDWDRRIQHVEVATLLLDLFEGLPESLREADFGLPKSSAVLDDPIYASADAIPNLLHEPIWLLDFFRRLQAADGGVSGGIDSAGPPLLGEPSFLEHQAVFAYAPDPIASYRYAGAAAHLARVLDGLGRAELAGLFRDSAARAWRSAEAGFADPDGAYADALSVGRRTNLFGAVGWEARRSTIQRITGEFRVAAAASLFRLGAGRAFGRIFEEAWAGGFGIADQRADMAWDYAQSEGAEAGIKAQIETAMVRDATLFASVQRAAAYPSMKHPYAPVGWGQGTAPSNSMIRLFIHAHRLSGNTELLKLMQMTAEGLLGANQLGVSFTTGLGTRQIRHPLHEDHRAMGVAVPGGITVYGFGPQAQFNPEWLFGPTWAIFPEDGAAATRRIDPTRFSQPYFEYFIEHPGMVMHQEYTVHQTIVTTAALWLYLAAQKGGSSR